MTSALRILAVAVLVRPALLGAQERLVGASSFMVAPSFTGWKFNRALPNDSFMVRKAWQFTVPTAMTIQAAGGRVTIDAGAAMAIGRVGLDDGRTLELSGLTDLRIRGVARVIGDQLLLTVGLNAPVGATRLSGHQIDALGVLGAQALGFTTPTLGNGLGATGGFVYALRAGGWGLAVGSSLEIRGQYTPLEAQIAEVRSPADLRPGTAFRFSLGADRLMGRGRISLLLAGDLFGESRIMVAAPGGDPVESTYKLGPQLAGSAILELGVRGFRSFTLAITDRYRSRFTGFDGEKASGSSGNLVEGSLGFITGQGGRAGLAVRVEGRFDSGLEVDNTITTAAMTSGGLTVGLFAPIGRATLQPFVRAQIGRLDTGEDAATATGFGGGIALTLRPW